jgi:hypothetical protein
MLAPLASEALLHMRNCLQELQYLSTFGEIEAFKGESLELLLPHPTQLILKNWLLVIFTMRTLFRILNASKVKCFLALAALCGTSLGVVQRDVELQTNGALNVGVWVLIIWIKGQA